MHVPAYQIHNVLNTYSLQLFKAGTFSQHADSDSDPFASRMSLETRRKAVIDKVASEIVQRITRMDTLATRYIVPSPVPADRTDAMRTEIRNKQFVFNTLDIHNIKTSRTLSIEDSIFFIKRDPP
ncbi:MAG: DVU0524 family FlgM-associated protein [Deltaproteobacteria bacterium]